MAHRNERKYNNPNQPTSILLLQLDLTISGEHTTTIPPPYLPDDTWEDTVQTTLTLLQNNLRRRKRLEGLVYAYYLGKLIIEGANTPRTQWRNFVQQYQIQNAAHYYSTSQRIYLLFKDRPNQMYLTRQISFNVISRLTVANYESLKYFAQNIYHEYNIAELMSGTS
jgi:hypothetical protein